MPDAENQVSAVDHPMSRIGNAVPGGRNRMPLCGDPLPQRPDYLPRDLDCLSSDRDTMPDCGNAVPEPGNRVPRRDQCVSADRQPVQAGKPNDGLHDSRVRGRRRAHRALEAAALSSDLLAAVR